jgi:outer membrane protein assembly factor BamD (BamD/ComL family)
LLRVGNYTAALQFLDSYDKMVGRHGAMQAEATVVRIEVLKAKGDKAAALALGKRFLARYPQGPYRFYVKRLLGLPLP